LRKPPLSHKKLYYDKLKSKKASPLPFLFLSWNVFVNPEKLKLPRQNARVKSISQACCIFALSKFANFFATLIAMFIATLNLVLYLMFCLNTA
jgi:hypothetical protein